MPRLATILLALVALVPSLARAENWPNWRGPSQSGVAEGKAYPTKWSSTENVAWKVKLPGQGASTPIVWEDRIFLTCGVAENGEPAKNMLLCYDRSGKELWRTEIGVAKAKKSAKGSSTNPSTVTDGKHVFVYFKSGDFGAVDFSGKIVWQMNLQEKYGEDTLWHDVGTSPVLTKNHVVATVMHGGPSFLAAFDKVTGKLAWKQDRNTGAPSESADSYTTPVVVRSDEQELIVVLGADYVTGHDAANGKELWRVGDLNPRKNPNFRSISSAVVSDGVVIAPYARGGTVTAIKLGGQGDVTETHVLWTKENLGADVPTPIAQDGKVYLCNDKGQISCLDLKTGDPLWTTQPEKGRATTVSSSPILAGGKLYITREDGKTYVITPEKDSKVVAENELPSEFVLATPVFVDGKVLLRTNDHLYCFGT
ncbi:MAG: PQQ-binding-like beta-propeller repeat protein [Pirellulaceae bacterium]